MHRSATGFTPATTPFRRKRLDARLDAFRTSRRDPHARCVLGSYHRHRRSRRSAVQNSVHEPFGDWFHTGNYPCPQELFVNRHLLSLLALPVVLPDLAGASSVRYIHRERAYCRFCCQPQLLAFGCKFSSVSPQSKCARLRITIPILPAESAECRAPLGALALITSALTAIAAKVRPTRTVCHGSTRPRS